jgi:hypothetical protein
MIPTPERAATVMTHLQSATPALAASTASASETSVTPRQGKVRPVRLLAVIACMAGLGLAAPAWSQSAGSEAASGPGIGEKAREAGGAIARDAKTAGKAVAEGAKEVGGAAASAAKEVWGLAKDGAKAVGSAASSGYRAAKKEIVGSGDGAGSSGGQAPAPVEDRSKPR